jgi:hypothetical protein
MVANNGLSLAACEAEMTTYPIHDPQGERVIAFEIENVYIGVPTIARLLESVDGITHIHQRRWFRGPDDVHVVFRFRDQECIVWEPYGDSSRYWIGPQSPVPDLDMRTVQEVFNRYQQPVFRRVVGNILSLRIFSSLIGRDVQ